VCVCTHPGADMCVCKFGVCVCMHDCVLYPFMCMRVCCVCVVCVFCFNPCSVRYRVCGSGFTGYGLVFRVQGLGFRV